MTGEELIRQFERGETPAESFHHSDHVRLAFEYLLRFPIIEALERFSGSIKRFATAHGKADKYHETITWAFLLLIRERLARARECVGRSPSWDEFAADNQDLLKGKDHVLRCYYRDETLKSELARRTFVFPDRNSIPSQEDGL